MKNQLILGLLLLLSNVLLNGQEWKHYPYHQEGTVLNFPADEGFHPDESIEWWYTTAHLIGTETGNEYTVMLTYFAYDTLVFDGFRILNIANETTGAFYNDMQLCNFSTIAEDHLEIEASLFPSFLQESWATSTDDEGNLVPFEYELSAASLFGSIQLDYNTIKRPLVVGNTGFFNQGVNNYTYYYSQTGVEVSGSLSLEGVPEAVTGTAWIDRQYGNFNPLNGEKYEWFSLQLSNGMDINMWNIFDVENHIPDTITYKIYSAYVDEETSYATADFDLERLGYSYTEDEQRCYANKWRLTSDENNIDLNITVINPKSEVVLPFYFFEGGTSIEGTVNGVEVTGVGFAELLHTYEKPEIELIAPSIDWSVDLPIVWQLNNDDDGRAVFYDVDVSYDDKETYQKIAQHLEDTQFLWTATDFPQDGLYWFKITGYSIDSTLVGVVETEVSYPLTEISEQFIQEGWRLYPNPAREAFYIDIPPQLQGAITVKLINESGQPVKTFVWDKAPNQFTIETRQLVAGNYFLEISSPHYNVVQMVTVVK